jgi:hypothetical protein
MGNTKKIYIIKQCTWTDELCSVTNQCFLFVPFPLRALFSYCFSWLRQLGRTNLPFWLNIKEQQEWKELSSETVFVNVEGDQESIPRNRFHQPTIHCNEHPTVLVPNLGG